MTVSTPTRSVVYTGPQSSPLAIPFRFFSGPSQADLSVYLYQIGSTTNPVELTLNTDYTIVNNGYTGGTLTLLANGGALASGYQLTIDGTPTETQLTSLQNQGAYNPLSVENALDLLTMITQSVSDTQAISIQATPGDVARSLILPTVANSAGLWLGINSSGNLFAGNPLGGSGSLAIAAGQVGVGVSTNALGGSSKLTFTTPGLFINLGTSASTVTAPAPTGMRIMVPDGTGAAINLEAYGSSCVFAGLAAGGTAASPAFIAAGSNITQLAAYGWKSANTWTIAGRIIISPINTWSSSDNSTCIRLQTTPTGSTSSAMVEVARMTQNLLVGTTTDMPGTFGLTLAGTTDCTVLGTGTLINDGGGSIAKNLYVGGLINVAGTAALGATTITGNASVSGTLTVGTFALTSLTLSGILTVNGQSTLGLSTGTFPGNLILGCQNLQASTSGCLGEVLPAYGTSPYGSTITSGAGATVVGSISVGVGVWLVSANGNFNFNTSSGGGVSQTELALSSTGFTTALGANRTQQFHYANAGTVSSADSHSIINYQFNASTTTTINLTALLAGNTAATGSFAGSMTAVRIR